MSQPNIQITPSEFYEKYWVIKDSNGFPHHPPKLSDAEKKFLDNEISIENSTRIMFIRKRRPCIQVDLNILRDEMRFLPDNLTVKKQDEFAPIKWSEEEQEKAGGFAKHLSDLKDFMLAQLCIPKERAGLVTKYFTPHIQPKLNKFGEADSTQI